MECDDRGGAPAVVHRLLCVVRLEHAPVRRKRGGGQVILRVVARRERGTSEQYSCSSLPAKYAGRQQAATAQASHNGTVCSCLHTLQAVPNCSAFMANTAVLVRLD